MEPQSRHLVATGPPAEKHADIHVVLAEDHAAMRRSLRLLLDSEPGIDVVAEAPDLSMAITHLHGQRPDVLVLDVRMPSGSSIDVIRSLREQAPSTQVVLITMHEGPAFANRAHAVGAVGYVLKDTADTELPDAVRRAARGEVYTSPRITPLAVPLPRR